MADLYGLPRGEEILLDIKLSQADIRGLRGRDAQVLNPYLKKMEQAPLAVLAASMSVHGARVSRPQRRSQPRPRQPVGGCASGLVALVP